MAYRSSNEDNRLVTNGDESDSEENGSHVRAGDGTDASSSNDTQNANSSSENGKRDSAIMYSKIGLFLVIFFAAISTSVAAYFLIHQSEEDEFQAEFHTFSSYIIETLESRIENSYSSMRDLSISVTSAALEDEKAVWPNFTMSHFGWHTREFLSVGNVEMIILAPLVHHEGRESWEEYATANFQAQGFDHASDHIIEADAENGHAYEEEGHEDEDDHGHDHIRRLQDVEEAGNHEEEDHDHDHEEDEHAHELDGEHYEESPAIFFNHSHVPMYQQAPFVAEDSLMKDLLTFSWFEDAATLAWAEDNAVFSVPVNDLVDLVHEHDADVEDEASDPHSSIVVPIHRAFELHQQEEGTHTADLDDLAGFVVGVWPWTGVLKGVLNDRGSTGTGRFIIVVESCLNSFTYELWTTGEINFLGYQDLHDPSYGALKREYTFNSYHLEDKVQDHDSHDGHNHHYRRTQRFLEEDDHAGQEEDKDIVKHCEYKITVYPTSDFEDQFQQNDDIWVAVGIFLVFVLAGLIFFVYDLLIQRRQRHLHHKAEQTSAIVASLFPENVQKRMMGDALGNSKSLRKSNVLREFASWDKRGSNEQALSNPSNTTFGGIYESDPIADLFPYCTVMFADISGFTAWSSTREPTQVFVLLETIYHEFDQIARKRRVFKVETIGDCYVAVCGLPTPRKDHAVVMAHFAKDCLEKTNTVTQYLEERLGPDTGDLYMRIGLHSGPVTAGVLRGEKQRFQLFGDTVNTTARIEALGVPNSIHISEDTAKLLMAAGKEHWLRRREEQVSAKGKGLLVTYWLELKSCTGSMRSGSTEDSEKIASAVSEQAPALTGSNRPNQPKDAQVATLSATEEQTTELRESPLSLKAERLVKWNVDVLSRLIGTIVSHRAACKVSPTSDDVLNQIEQDSLQKTQSESGLVLDEVKEVICLPAYKLDAADIGTQKLDSTVMKQLQHYVQTIATLYRDNSFHNFEHVSHVTMSVTKLLSRIVAPENYDGKDSIEGQTLHDHTYGITSDPLTQFAVVFSALIHDVDHQGVSNAQLVKEETQIATAYHNRSVAEQNSFDIAWYLLLDEAFTDLRRAIYSTESEFHRFRQLVVNAVMATDIMDKELSKARKARWEKAFSMDDITQENKNRKATIVIEHLIQASDVAHTMQHWHVYRKWNQRLFFELSEAYRTGRSDTDPADNWYKGEMGFFDFYIIPLAKKLKNCGVFGVSSDEYLNYAMKNRAEWELKGKEVVEEMQETLKQNRTKQ